MNTLEEYRTAIDEIDDCVLALFAKRFGIIRNITQLKEREGMPLLDKKRESQILTRLTKDGAKRGLGKQFVQAIWEIILNESRREQKHV